MGLQCDVIALVLVHTAFSISLSARDIFQGIPDCRSPSAKLDREALATSPRAISPFIEYSIPVVKYITPCAITIIRPRFIIHGRFNKPPAPKLRSSILETCRRARIPKPTTSSRSLFFGVVSGFVGVGISCAMAAVSHKVVSVHISARTVPGAMAAS